MKDRQEGRRVRIDRKDCKGYNSYKPLLDIVGCGPPNIIMQNARRKEKRAHILLFQEQGSVLILARTQLIFVIVKRGYY